MLRKRSLSTLISLLSCALFAAPAFAAPPEYAVIDLGILPGAHSSAGLGISYYGATVGINSSAVITQRAFYSAGGAMFDLGTLPGYTNSRAEGLTEFAPFWPIIVGWSSNDSDPGGGRAFADVFGAMFDLGSLGGPNSRAHAIADQGFIVGESQPGQAPAGIWHAFRTQPFSYINPATDDLGTLAGATSSFATAVNNWAMVTGNSGGHAYRTAPYSKINPFTDDLGTLGGGFSIGFGINQAGAVAGVSNTALISTLTGKPIDHAFLYDSAGMHDLGTTAGFESSAASALNDKGQVVGSLLNAPPDVHAMLWDKKHGMRDLNTLIPSGANWTLQIGHAINSRGQIVGWGLHAGLQHAFLLQPL